MTTPTPVPEVPADALEEAFQDDLFPPLTLNDRCDADAAEAAVAQVMVKGTRLFFCGHHWRTHAAELIEAGHPYSVADDEAQPFTERRAQELGAKAAKERLQGDDHA